MGVCCLVLQISAGFVAIRGLHTHNVLIMFVVVPINFHHRPVDCSLSSVHKVGFLVSHKLHNVSMGIWS